MAPPFYDIILNSNKMNEIMGLILKCQNVNKTHEIINQKNTPPFYDIILNSNKMNEIIYLLETKKLWVCSCFRNCNDRKYYKYNN